MRIGSLHWLSTRTSCCALVHLITPGRNLHLTRKVRSFLSLPFHSAPILSPLFSQHSSWPRRDMMPSSRPLLNCSFPVLMTTRFSSGLLWQPRSLCPDSRDTSVRFHTLPFPLMGDGPRPARGTAVSGFGTDAPASLWPRFAATSVLCIDLRGVRIQGR